MRPANTLSLLTLCLSVTLAGCQHNKPTEQSSSQAAGVQDGPPDLVLDPASITDAIPQYEPRSRYGNHSPYTVFGKQYEVMESGQSLIQEGIASWYGTKFHGKRTSSWEPYDMLAMTAAHRELPLPTYVKVTNLDNKRSAILKVNDRGPFHGDRIIDLSYAAAVRLGFARQGTAPVRVEAIPMDALRPQQTSTLSEEAEATSSASVATAKHTKVKQALDTAAATVKRTPPAEQLYLQVGAYSEKARAEHIQTDLAQWITFPISIKQNVQSGLYRVQVGPLRSSVQAKAIHQLLAKEFDIHAPLLVWN